MKTPFKENSVSPVFGIAVLIAIAVVLSALVFTTTGGILTGQQAPSAGANVTIASESTIQVQLDSVQNADNVYVQSPLGTRYKFDGIGDTVEILNIGNKQKPVVIAEKDGKEQIVQGITPRSFDADYVVSETGLNLSEALKKADSTENETIVIKRGEYTGDVDITKESKIIAEHGTTIEGTVTVSDAATFSNAEIVGGSINVNSTGVYLASNTGSIDDTGYEDDVVIVDSTHSLIQEVDDTTSSTQTTTVSNVAPSADFTFSPTSPVTGENVSFDGSNSVDEDGSIESYEWDFNGDGNTDATGETTEKSFASSGDYTVELTVNDGDKTASKTETVTVSEVSPPSSGVYTKFKKSWFENTGDSEIVWNDGFDTRDSGNVTYNLVSNDIGGYGLEMDGTNNDNAMYKTSIKIDLTGIETLRIHHSWNHDPYSRSGVFVGTHDSYNRDDAKFYIEGGASGNVGEDTFEVDVSGYSGETWVDLFVENRRWNGHTAYGVWEWIETK